MTTTAKKFTNLKNELFIYNSLCPITNLYTLKVWGFKYRKLSKREVDENKDPVVIKTLLWEYFSDRCKQSVGQVLRSIISSEYFEAHIYHSGNPQPYILKFTENEKNLLKKHKQTEHIQKKIYLEKHLDIIENKINKITKSSSKNKDKLLEKYNNKFNKLNTQLFTINMS